MKSRPIKQIFLPLSLITPIVLIALFYTLRNHTPTMIWWTEGPLPFFIKPFRQLSGLLPFSLGEWLIITTVLFFLWLIPSRIYGKLRKQKPLCQKKELAILLSLVLWLGAGLCWLWNPLYYVPTLAERANLDLSPYPVEDLILLTHYFAQGAQEYAPQVSRDDTGQFNVPSEEYFQEALLLYEKTEETFPFLAMENVPAKSLRLSQIQSYFGFTGVYNPFTGEANINTHTPAVLHPVTIAHEMAHQRLIAPETEANFLAIVACLDSDSTTFRYSGYLFGLMQLSNALYPVAPEIWQEIVDLYFTPEISTDWQSNYNYWQSFQSPVEEVAKEAYDGFLKGNQQELGIRSYGACVDLLVSYYRNLNQV